MIIVGAGPVGLNIQSLNLYGIQPIHVMSILPGGYKSSGENLWESA